MRPNVDKRKDFVNSKTAQKNLLKKLAFSIFFLYDTGLLQEILYYL